MTKNSNAEASQHEQEGKSWLLWLSLFQLPGGVEEMSHQPANFQMATGHAQARNYLFSMSF